MIEDRDKAVRSGVLPDKDAEEAVIGCASEKAAPL